MRNSFKVAISIPKEDFEKIEALRGKMKIGRSALIDKAIRFWLEWIEREDLVRQYEEGYRRIPEKVTDLGVFEYAELEVLNPEERW